MKNFTDLKPKIFFIAVLLLIFSISLCSCQREISITIPQDNNSSDAGITSATNVTNNQINATERIVPTEKETKTSISEIVLSTSADPSGRMGISNIVDKIQNSVVAINITGTVTDYFWGTYPTEGSGSGVIISQDGYIVTNRHVISDGDTITVFLSDGEKCSAELVGSDSKTDLAVIKIDKDGLVPAVFGNSSTLRVGDYAIAIGNPTGELQGTVTMGIISALDRKMTFNGVEMTMLQTDAAVSPGNSGGGLFDSNGTLIGIVTAKNKDSDVEGLGFVIPIDYAYPIIRDLASFGYVTGRPSLGFETVDITNKQSMLRNGLNWMGVYINKVYSDSSAMEAGLKFKDYIKSVDGEEITTGDRLIEILNAKSVGDTIVLEIWRDDDIFDIVLKIDEEKNNS